MADSIVIHPLNRCMRPLRLELTVEAGKVINAKAGVTQYWDFAAVLYDKDPLDSLQLTQRWGGFGFTAHAVAAARALEKLAQLTIPVYAQLVRNIILALDIVYDHITHFYQTVLPDYVPLPGKGPFRAGKGDFRLSAGISGSVVNNFWRAFDIRRSIHQALSLIGGKAPHLCGVVFGGISKKLELQEIIKINSLLKEITGFIDNEYAGDVAQIERFYGEYSNMGAGVGRFLSGGEFARTKEYTFQIPGAVIFDQEATPFEVKNVFIDCTGSKFAAREQAVITLSDEVSPTPNKKGGYSWIKGAVYGDKPCETGAWARMVLSGSLTETLGQTVSVVGRYRARLEECKLLVKNVGQWLDRLNPGLVLTEPGNVSETGQAIGVAESAGGPVIHFVALKDGRINKYSVLDASSWNLCPGTRDGQLGPLEQALAGLMIEQNQVPVSVLRVARSF